MGQRLCTQFTMHYKQLTPRRALSLRVAGGVLFYKESESIVFTINDSLAT